MQPLKGKIALVTGASRGIGRGIAQRLASAGATVIVAARSVNQAASTPGTLAETVELITAAGGKALPIGVDLDNAQERQSLVERAADLAGGLDILVNNAGIAQYSRVETMSAAIYEQTLNHYQRVPFVLSQAAIPVMKARGAGWIVNVGSVTAQMPLRPFDIFATQGGATIYAAVKAYLNRFTVGLAAELLENDIAVNLVAPSTAIRTPGASDLIPQDYPTEPIEYLAETALALCHLPARERTGLLAHSLHFPLAMGLTVHTLDGKGTLPPPVIPSYAHPAIPAAGQ